MRTYECLLYGLYESRERRNMISYITGDATGPFLMIIIIVIVARLTYCYLTDDIGPAIRYVYFIKYYNGKDDVVQLALSHYTKDNLLFFKDFQGNKKVVSCDRVRYIKKVDCDL